MQPIQVNKTSKDLNDQFVYFIRRGHLLKLRSFKRFIISLLVLTIIVLALSLHTDNDKFIELKAVLIGLTTISWICTLIYLPTIFISRYKKLRTIDRYINSLDKNQLNYSITFDNDKISFITDEATLDIDWVHYQYYSEYNNSLYVFSETKPSDSLYYSKNEIGEINYNQLKAFVTSKIPELKKIVE